MTLQIRATPKADIEIGEGPESVRQSLVSNALASAKEQFESARLLSSSWSVSDEGLFEVLISLEVARTY